MGLSTETFLYLQFEERKMNLQRTKYPERQEKIRRISVVGAHVRQVSIRREKLTIWNVTRGWEKSRMVKEE